jgi:hypothetical protein
MPVLVAIFARPWHKETMSTPKVVFTFNSHMGDVIVIIEAYGFTRGWTVEDKYILGGPISLGGVISLFVEPEAFDLHMYDREGEEWWSYTAEEAVKIVSPRIAAELNLVELAAAAFKSSGPIQ